MTSKNLINFTKTTLAELSPPTEKKRTTFYDRKIPALALIIQRSGTRAFYLVKTINGKTERVFLGKFPDLSVENARKKAESFIGDIANGINPQDDKREQRESITFGELFQLYMERYSKQHKKSWIYDEREIPKFLSHWFQLKAADISKATVRLLVEKVYCENGKYQANRIRERISSMYNKGIEWELVALNPAVGIKKYKEDKRDRFLLPNELPYFIRALNEETNETLRDYIWICLLTGVRKTNVMQLRSEQILWDLNQWRIPTPKNGEPLIVVLHPKAREILERRYKKSKSAWIFSKSKNEYAPLTYHEKAIRRIREKATIYSWFDNPAIGSWVKAAFDELPKHYNSGTGYKQITKRAARESLELPIGLMDFRFHDIRRTLGSYQAINGTSLEIIGKSLGHKSLQSTQIYARLILEPVKQSVENAIETMLAKCA